MYGQVHGKETEMIHMEVQHQVRQMVIFKHFYWSIVLYNVVLVSTVQQSQSVTLIEISLSFSFPSHLDQEH